MKVDLIGPSQLARAGRAATEAEQLGYDGFWTAETQRDPFLPLAVASQETSEIELGTSIAVAFARNPMNLANLARDLQDGSQGRFVLGLGSQIRPHITKRFSMPWSDPARRMRELILAMQTIWGCWQTGEKLRFKGDYYTHLLMTPFFDPGPSDFPAPKVYLAGVGSLMTAVAGEVCDGFLAHPFTTPSYLVNVTIPALQKGMDRSDNSRDRFEISLPPLIATGTDEESMSEAVTSVRERIAFYASTPAYLPVLEHHDRGDLQPQLNTLSKQGEWQAMADLIDDDLLHEIAVVAEPKDLAGEITARFGGLVDRVTIESVDALSRDDLSRLVVDLQTSERRAI